MTRLNALMGAALALSIGGAATNAVAAAPVVAGTWKVKYDGGTHNTFASWGLGGSVTEAADFPPLTGNNYQVGSWKRNANGTFSAKLNAWIYDSTGATLVQTLVKTETITVTGDSFTGTFTVSYFDLMGNPGFTHTGTVAGTRIPLP